MQEGFQKAAEPEPRQQKPREPWAQAMQERGLAGQKARGSRFLWEDARCWTLTVRQLESAQEQAGARAKEQEQG